MLQLETERGGGKGKIETGGKEEGEMVRKRGRKQTNERESRIIKEDIRK